jgi:hypothetical protein
VQAPPVIVALQGRSCCVVQFANKKMATRELIEAHPLPLCTHRSDRQRHTAICAGLSLMSSRWVCFGLFARLLLTTLHGRKECTQ